MTTPRLEVLNIHKTFGSGANAVHALRGASLSLNAGESLAVMGSSGCGKSTLLHIIGTLDRPDSGRVKIDGEDPFRLNERELARFRNRDVGFVFQDHCLLPQYSGLENALLPTIPMKTDRAEARKRAEELMKRVGLLDRQMNRPAELSGGERQRFAAVRAMINRPKLLLCDEPTGNLDEASAQKAADALFELQAAEGASLAIVTHDPGLAARCDRRVRLEGGMCVEV